MSARSQNKSLRPRDGRAEGMQAQVSSAVFRRIYNGGVRLHPAERSPCRVLDGVETRMIFKWCGFSPDLETYSGLSCLEAGQLLVLRW